MTWEFGIFCFGPPNKLSFLEHNLAKKSDTVCATVDSGTDLAHLTRPLSDCVAAGINEFPDTETGPDQITWLPHSIVGSHAAQVQVYAT